MFWFSWEESKLSGSLRELNEFHIFEIEKIRLKNIVYFEKLKLWQINDLNLGFVKPYAVISKKKWYLAMIFQTLLNL